jgi:hypothetical protein
MKIFIFLVEFYQPIDFFGKVGVKMSQCRARSTLLSVHNFDDKAEMAIGCSEREYFVKVRKKLLKFIIMLNIFLIERIECRSSSGCETGRFSKRRRANATFQVKSEIYNSGEGDYCEYGLWGSCRNQACRRLGQALTNLC